MPVSVKVCMGMEQGWILTSTFSLGKSFTAQPVELHEESSPSFEFFN